MVWGPPPCLEPQILQFDFMHIRKLLKIDKDTLNKNILQRARVLIRTSLSEIPRSPVEVKIDDNVFHIWIIEEDEDVEDSYDDWSSDEDKVC